MATFLMLNGLFRCFSKLTTMMFSSRTFHLLCLLAILAGAASTTTIVYGVADDSSVARKQRFDLEQLGLSLQFLVEAMSICVAGGLVGIALGSSAASLLASFAGWSTPLSVSAIALAFGFSAGIGLLFGMLPARKAAKLDPIAALRYE